MDDSYYQSLRIFISSPSDVNTERQIAEDVITKIDIRVRDILRIRADCRKWEHEPPFATSDEEKIQDKINESIRNCHVFVLILNKRYGSVERGSKKSYTEQEVDLALSILKEHKRIMFLSYFRKLPDHEDIGPQEKSVIALRRRLGQQSVLYKEYGDTTEFRDLLTHDLYDTILRFRLSTSKQKALKSFWQLGIVDGQANPKLTIIYPLLDRNHMRQEDPDKVWLDRLVPHVVFEDFKAIQKIDKTLRLIGFGDIETFSSLNYPPDIQDKNRLWLCLPRNPPALFIP